MSGDNVGVTDSKLDKELLKAVFNLANRPEVDHLLFISDKVLDPAELRGKKCRKKLIYAVSNEPLAQELHLKKERAVVIPSYDYSRTERVKMAVVSALAQGVFKGGDTVLCVTGKIGRHIDTLMTMKIGTSLDDRVAIEGIKLGEEFNSQVVDSLIQIALQIGQEGFEGHPIGTILVIGDHTAVLETSRQLTLIHFKDFQRPNGMCLIPKFGKPLKTFRCSMGPL